MNIKETIQDSIDVKRKILQDEEMIRQIQQAASICIDTLKAGGKILLCGNGGSAADAQHIAAELSGRFIKDRKPLFAEALHVNTSFMTAVANDYGYDAVFERMVEASGRKGDILIALSTSGNSPSILRAADKARDVGMKAIGMTGATGGSLAGRCEICLKVPSGITARIQESHILIGHILCGQIEEALFPE